LPRRVDAGADDRQAVAGDRHRIQERPPGGVYTKIAQHVVNPAHAVGFIPDERRRIVDGKLLVVILA
jgi:hypothetical protein